MIHKSKHEDHEEIEGHEGIEGHEEIEGHEAIKGHEGHEECGVRPAGRGGRYRMRIPSPLSHEEELVMTAVIACAIAVHSELGPGFLESIYHKAMCVEFERRGMAFESERPVVVDYRGVPLRGQRVDLVVQDRIVVELKCVDRLHEIHERQVVSYLRSTGLRGGLLINFQTSLVKHGIRRVVL
jgi:GxxExxY protein